MLQQTKATGKPPQPLCERAIADPRPGYRRALQAHYSAEIVRRHFGDVIKNHPLNTNYGFSAEDVANLLEGKPEAGNALFWGDLISGQLDADRMDYLLRDSLHCGVSYGGYDWQRLIHTVAAVPAPALEGGLRIGVTEGGWHAAEGLIVARYFMFTQVYFYKTRVIYDYHLQAALAELLPGGQFPTTEQGPDEYLNWDDWRVLGLLADGGGGDHGRLLASRGHFREITHTPETPSPNDLARLEKWRTALGDLLVAEIPAEKSRYKMGRADVQILAETPPRNRGHREVRALRRAGRPRCPPPAGRDDLDLRADATHQFAVRVDPRSC